MRSPGRRGAATASGAHPGGRRRHAVTPRAGRRRPRLRVGAGRRRALGVAPVDGGGPAARQRPGHASRSTPRRHLRARRARQASAGWSTTATRATPTTTARRTATSSSTGPSRWSCAMVEAGPLRGRLRRRRPLPTGRSGSTTPRPRGSAGATSTVSTAARAAGRRAVRAGDDELDNRVRGPPPAGVVPAARAGPDVGAPSARSRTVDARPRRRRAARRSRRCPRSRPAGSCRRAG